GAGFLGASSGGAPHHPDGGLVLPGGKGWASRGPWPYPLRRKTGGWHNGSRAPIAHRGLASGQGIKGRGPHFRDRGGV
ncbi:hypothetical protein ABTM64_21475, partial [Acinetobacter baumannii]